MAEAAAAANFRIDDRARQTVFAYIFPYGEIRAVFLANHAVFAVGPGQTCVLPHFGNADLARVLFLFVELRDCSRGAGLRTDGAELIAKPHGLANAVGRRSREGGIVELGLKKLTELAVYGRPYTNNFGWAGINAGIAARAAFGKLFGRIRPGRKDRICGC